MKKINFYSQEMQTIFRIISLIAMIILFISNTRRIVVMGLEGLIADKYKFSGFITNSVSIFLFLLVILYPTKWGILELSILVQS